MIDPNLVSRNTTGWQFRKMGSLKLSKMRTALHKFSRKFTMRPMMWSVSTQATQNANTKEKWTSRKNWRKWRKSFKKGSSSFKSSNKDYKNRAHLNGQTCSEALPSWQTQISWILGSWPSKCPKRHALQLAKKSRLTLNSMRSIPRWSTTLTLPTTLTFKKSRQTVARLLQIREIKSKTNLTFTMKGNRV